MPVVQWEPHCSGLGEHQRDCSQRANMAGHPLVLQGFHGLPDYAPPIRYIENVSVEGRHVALVRVHGLIELVPSK